MPTSYSSLLGLALPVQGELAGSWGNVVNTAITELLDTAVAGTTTLSTDADVTLTDTTGASNQSRQAILMCTGARTVLRTVTAPARSKLYIVNNATTGGYGVKIVGVGPTTGVTVVAGETAVVAWNGTDFVKIAGQNGAYSFTGSVFNGTVGATTPSTGAFTTLSASSTVSGAGFVSRFSAPGAIGDVTPSTGAFTTLSASGNISQADGFGLVWGSGTSTFIHGSQASGYVRQRINGVDITNATSTGLAVTGALSATGNISTASGNVFRAYRNDNATYGDISHGNSGTGLIYNDANGDGHSFRLGGVDAAVINSAGNLGLGVTPSAWSGLKALEIAGVGSSLASASNNNLYLSANAWYNGTNWRYGITAAASQYQSFSGQHIWYTAPSGTAGNAITFTQAMTLDASGNLNVGITGTAYHRISKSVADGSIVGAFTNLTGGTYFYGAETGGANAAATAVGIDKNTTTSRSINAGGTINASGADYAEYENNNGLKFTKGDLVGFKADGTLTQSFAESVRFGIKSTNPSYVGGDTWGSEDAVGKRPEQPQFVPPEYTGTQDPGAEPVPPVAPADFAAVVPEAPGENATELQAFIYAQQVAAYKQAAVAHAQALDAFDVALADYSQKLLAHESARHLFTMDQAEHAARVEVAQNLFDTATMPEYERALAAFEAALEAERQKVDRVAYSGKVPVNVLGAVPGGYIVAVATDDGFIAGRFVPDPDFAQYKKAVGRVNRILPDGRCEVAVMVH